MTPSKHLALRIIGLVIFTILSIPGVGQAEDNKPVSLKELAVAFEMQRIEIKTARVEMQHTNGVARINVNRGWPRLLATCVAQR